MTDDESFIRAIIAAPGDDAPRLVYADWLDERGSPRGAYLRREVEVFRQPRTGPEFRAVVNALMESASDLHAIWVDRVSRPPVGICSDVIRYDLQHLIAADGPQLSIGPAITNDDLVAFETRLRVRIPDQYKAFVLNHNGGYPYPGEFLLTNLEPDDLPISLDCIAGIAPRSGEPADYRGPALLTHTYEDPQVPQGRLIPIGGDGSDGCLLLGTTGEHDGVVIFHDDYTHEAWDYERYVVVGRTLGEFLTRLMTSDPIWAQHIVRGDHSALRRWLDEGGDINAVHAENEYSLIDYAIDWHRLEMIRELIARGARVGRRQRKLGGYHGNRDVATLIDAALRR